MDININKEEISIEENRKKQNIKILVVEDDVFLTSLLTGRLDKEGYKISCVNDGVKALKFLESEIPDIVFLDIIMPEMNGFETLKKIRADSRYKNVSIIIFSNLSQEYEIEEGKKLGADEFLIKSNFTLKEVVNKINELLHQKGKI
ncbi:MAG: response regulator [Minisyncoccia bacterium]